MKIIIRLYYKLLSYLIRLKIKSFLLSEFLTRGDGYRKWILVNEGCEKDNRQFAYTPLISIILPVYNVKESFLRECIESVINQYYQNWELCIVDDNSSEPYIKRTLDEYCNADKRIKVLYRNTNGHISACSNTALTMVTGEFTALLDNDDILAPFAFYQVVKQLNINKDFDLIYSDEDKLIEGKRAYPFFKKKYNKNLIYQMNYICHLAIYRTALLKNVKGFREGIEGVQDWDLAIRIMQLTDKILHIPIILYHWRVSGTSTAGGEHRKTYIKAARKKMFGKYK